GAINPVAQADHFFKRLDVDVACAVFNRLNQDEVGEFDHGSFLDGRGQLVEVDFLDLLFDGLQVVSVGIHFGLFGGVLDDVLHAAGFAGLQVLQLFDDRLFRGDQGGHIHASDAADIVN